MRQISRRQFAHALAAAPLAAQAPGERPNRSPDVVVENPRCRVPVSLIIDDSTCLVNLAHFCIPQFAEVFPDRYRQNWKAMPREIPDAFVRRFGEWCHEHGVKGKYSVVPYPACVGWVDRDIPGWSKRELEDSLELIRTLMMPDWDIHPEMVTHTWAIDTRTGRPFPERSARVMENFGFSEGKSADELAEYLAYALRVLRNAGLACEGITTPGGFGGRVLPELARAVLQSCREVFRTEAPHYFRHAFLDARSVAPRVEYASGLATPDPRCVVSIVACTSDWFGGWDGVSPGNADLFITPDLRGGRMPEVIRRGEPAVIACHWAGIYYNGQEQGFRIFQEVVRRLHAAYDNLIWMKLSEIARYWAAKELTSWRRHAAGVAFQAPYGCPGFTVQLAGAQERRSAPRLKAGGQSVPLREVNRPLDLKAGTWTRRGEAVVACFDLPKGTSELLLDPA